MLLSRTEEEWHSAYNDACVILVDHPRKLEKLKDIFDKPSSYAGYYVRRIPGNLNANGSALSEASHSYYRSFWREWSLVFYVPFASPNRKATVFTE